MGKVSGFAWALGFFGGIVCLILAKPYMGGLSNPAMADQTRVVPLITAAFFLLAGIPTFLFLKERGSPSQLPEGESYFSVSFGRLKETMQHVSQLTELVKFLGVFTVFNCGLSVVVYFTAIFAESEIGFNAAELTQFFILTNLVAAFGAFGFGILQDKIGAKKAISLTLVIWMCATVLAYFSHDKSSFWVVGFLAGSALGATQSGSRALIGELSPPSRSAEFFGFWGLFWKLSEAIGPLVFGIISAMAATECEGRRMGILFTTLFFLVGFIGMFFIDHEKGVREAEAYEAKSLGLVASPEDG
jgi:UMF1 family MFS transporter